MRKDSTSADRPLALLTIVLSLVVLAMLALHYPQYSASGRAGADASECAPTAGGQAPAEQVRLDYLYADWCSYCALTHPALLSVSMRMGSSVSLNEYDEKLRTSDAQVAALYADYKKRQVFVLFPTIVAHGPKGESALSGMQSEEAIQKWLCAQYTQAPATCRNPSG